MRSRASDRKRPTTLGSWIPHIVMLRAHFGAALSNATSGCVPTARWVIDPLCRSRGLTQLIRRAPRAGNKLTTTDRAISTKNGLNTRNTERALERTDSCFHRFWREVFVAALAVWTYLKHRFLLGLVKPNMIYTFPIE